DLIQPYRLEMGTRLANNAGKNLYEFWGSRITGALNEAFSQQKDKQAILLNLASTEYFKSVNKKQLAATVITPVFKDEKAGLYKVVGIYAKRARGLMVNYIVKNRIKDVEGIKAFEVEGYRYNPAMSDGNEWVFSRTEKDRA
ncbi:MAG: peroxide stress protein YaaA, partial [Pseudomonadales bacterium]|nr:peroxide stress protein YaaA [Pseudomonadales bacterium]